MKIFGKKKSAPPQENAALVQKQAERIRDLKAENERLWQELSKARERETDVVKTLEFARKKTDEYVSDVRQKYAYECDRLARFREKLQKYRTKDALIEAYDEAFRELKEWQAELEKSAASDLGAPVKDYLTERERLGDTPDDLLPERPLRAYADLSTADRISDEDLRDLLDQL